jgi:hypothetical protein
VGKWVAANEMYFPLRYQGHKGNPSMLFMATREKRYFAHFLNAAELPLSNDCDR